MFSMTFTRINGWVNNGEAGDLKRHRAHYDVTVMERNVCSEEMIMWSRMQFLSGKASSTTNQLWSQVFKSYGAKIWQLYPAPCKIGTSFDEITTWSKRGLDQPANVVSPVCLQLDFPIISMYSNRSNRENHNCLIVLKWFCGLIWSIVHGYDFCLLHLSEIVCVSALLMLFWSNIKPLEMQFMFLTLS